MNNTMEKEACNIIDKLLEMWLDICNFIYEKNLIGEYEKWQKTKNK